MLRIAIQAKGRLSEESLALLREAGIEVDDTKRKFLSRSSSFPVEILYLRDDDIPQAVEQGVADLGIVGYNEVCERGGNVKVVDRLGFGACRISLAIPKAEDYPGLDYFNGKRIATSYPNILRGFFGEERCKRQDQCHRRFCRDRADRGHERCHFRHRIFRRDACEQRAQGG